MTDRVIPCPDCGGSGGVAYQYPGEPQTNVYCGLCVGSPGTIVDRRRATPIEDSLRAEVANSQAAIEDLGTEMGRAQRTERGLRAEVAALKQGAPCACRFESDADLQRCEFHEAREVAIQEWAERAKVAEAEVAKLSAERDRYRDQFRAAKRSVCDLEARYMGDLTKQQRAALYDMDVFCNSLDRKDVLSIDAAIRAVRAANMPLPAATEANDA